MKNLYIICDLFPPAFAPRVAYLVKYLPAYGWSPIVFAEEVDAHLLFSDQKPTCPHYHIPLQACNSFRHKLQQLRELFFEAKEKVMYDSIKNILVEEEIPQPHAVLCLTYRKFPLASAHRLARDYAVPFMADCRDIIEQYSSGDFLPRRISLFGRKLPFLEKLIAKRFIAQRNKYLREAQAISTVSLWHKQVLSQVKPCVEVIYNGFDDELFYPQRLKTESFKIVYTGRLLSLEMRNPHLLFETLASEKLRSLPISIDFYTDDYSKALLEGEDLICSEHRLNIYPMKPSKEVPKLLSEASIILLLSNDEDGADAPKGMVSTKIFEALAMAKPCLLLPIDKGETVDLLYQAKAGLASNQLQEIVNFILAQYQHWQERGETTAPIDENIVSQFSRRKQAKAFANQLDHLINE